MNLSRVFRTTLKWSVLLSIGLPLAALAAGSAAVRPGPDAAPLFWQDGGTGAGASAYVLVRGGQAWRLIIPGAQNGLQDFGAILSTEQQAANLNQAYLGAIQLLLADSRSGADYGGLPLGHGFALRPIAAAGPIGSLFGLPDQPSWIR